MIQIENLDNELGNILYAEMHLNELWNSPFAYELKTFVKESNIRYSTIGLLSLYLRIKKKQP